jgi:hypothetical protein
MIPFPIRPNLLSLLYVLFRFVPSRNFFLSAGNMHHLNPVLPANLISPWTYSSHNEKTVLATEHYLAQDSVHVTPYTVSCST